MKKITLVCLAIFMLSCSKNDENNDSHCNFNTEVPECCFSGSDFASVGETIDFTNKFPGPNAEMEWEILHGDITILNVENRTVGEITESVATLKFNDGFDIGRFKARGQVTGSSCAHYHNIRIPD